MSPRDLSHRVKPAVNDDVSYTSKFAILHYVLSSQNNNMWGEEEEEKLERRGWEETFRGDGYAQGADCHAILPSAHFPPHSLTVHVKYTQHSVRPPYLSRVVLKTMVLEAEVISLPKSRFGSPWTSSPHPSYNTFFIK